MYQKNFAQTMVDAFVLAALSLGAPLWAQTSKTGNGWVGTQQIPPDGGTSSAERPGSQEKGRPEWGAPAGNPATPAERVESPQPVESRTPDSFEATTTAAEIDKAAEKPEPPRTTTIKTESGSPLEVKIVNAPGGKVVQTRYRYKNRWRTRTKFVPVGLSAAQERAVFAQVLREAGVASKADLEVVSSRLSAWFAKADQKLDDIGTGQKAGFEEVKSVVREEGQQTRGGLIVLFCCLIAAMFIVAATAITALRR